MRLGVAAGVQGAFPPPLERLFLNEQAKQTALLTGAAISLFGAVIHWISPLLGPDWYAWLRAPKFVVESARAGTWLAPTGAVVIGGLMFICALYAWSAMGRMARLPLLRTALLVIAAIGLLRGLALLPYAWNMPQLIDTFDVVGSLVWFVAGLGFALGARRNWAGLASQAR
jgi:hypothetical protein